MKKEKKDEKKKDIDLKNIEERVKEINANKGFVLTVSTNPETKRTDSSLSMKGVSANDVLAEIEKFKIAFIYAGQSYQKPNIEKEEKTSGLDYAH
ncbi:MAG: hypothetical protein ABIE23_05600 [archaeon]